jgi:Ca-activated chloride channel family protein
MAVLIPMLLLFYANTAHAQGEAGDRTLSPYFFVKSDDPHTDQLPLKSTSADVKISGVIADVLVTQVYKNEGRNTLEAIYVFPASTRAAVYGMRMTIGQRVIVAEIKKRDEARRDYELARQQGKSASLLEQRRPNVFQMSVANIMPGDEIKVELKYTELLVPEDRVYEFVYPTVVGPRYSNQPERTASPAEHWVQNPYLHQGEAPHYTFDITVRMATGMPIGQIASPSHKVTTMYGGPAAATITLDKTDQFGGNRDFVLRYRMDGDRVQSGLLLYEGEKENFFLLMIQPPARITNAEIPAREYIFIVDVSGSMHGFPLEISKNLLKNLIGNLRSTDRFNVLLFSGGSSVMAETSVPATAENIRRAIHLIDRQQGGGGTELLPALKRALALEKDAEYSRTIVIATDGYVTVEEEVFDLIRNNLGNANMFAFGIGTGVNRHIIEGMARVGMGEPFVISKAEEAPAQAERFRKLIQSPVLTNVGVEFSGFSAYDVEPSSIPDVLAERPVIVFGKWRGEPQGKIVLTGTSGSGAYSESIDVAKRRPSKDNLALQYLWARHRITLLSDYNKLRSDDARIKEVTDLGLTYNLLTAYTSFVAVDSEVRNTEGTATTVNQPLPLPQGVSDYAVGGLVMSAVVPMAPPMQADKSIGRYMAREKVAKDERGAERPRESLIGILEVTTTGGLTKEAILEVARSHFGEMDPCYIANAPTGKSTVVLTIGPDGTVKDVRVASGTLKGSRIESCVIQKIKAWRFPSPASGREAKVTMVLSVG